MLDLFNDQDSILSETASFYFTVVMDLSTGIEAFR